MHVTISLIPPPHLVKAGINPTSYTKVVLLENVPDTIEASIRSLVTDERMRQVISASGCLNVLIQRHRPKALGAQPA